MSELTTADVRAQLSATLQQIPIDHPRLQRFRSAFEYRKGIVGSTEWVGRASLSLALRYALERALGLHPPQRRSPSADDTVTVDSEFQAALVHAVSLLSEFSLRMTLSGLALRNTSTTEAYLLNALDYYASDRDSGLGPDIW